MSCMLFIFQMGVVHFIVQRLKHETWSAWKKLANKGTILSNSRATMMRDINMEGASMVDFLGSSIVQGVGKNAVRWKMYRSGNGECLFVPSITIWRI